MIIASTEGEDINYLAANWGEKWGIGDAQKDNGILVLLAKEDRKIAIQNGKGVEYLMTDFQSKRIIDTPIAQVSSARIQYSLPLKAKII